MNAVALSERDLSRTREVLTACADGDEDGDLLPGQLIRLLGELIDCDALSVLRSEPGRVDQGVDQSWPQPYRAADDPWAEAFMAHFWQSPCCYPDRTGDLVSITKDSDFLSDRAYHASPMYRDYFRHWDVEREIMMVIPTGPTSTLRLMFIRGRGNDFTENDRTLLALLRPHIQEAYLATQRRHLGIAPLTARQREVLHYVAAGLGNQQIARRLSVSEGTVRKHLENIFARLEVTSRTGAVARAGISAR